jgi:hypothetical protein
MEAEYRLIRRLISDEVLVLDGTHLMNDTCKSGWNRKEMFIVRYQVFFRHQRKTTSSVHVAGLPAVFLCECMQIASVPDASSRCWIYCYFYFLFNLYSWFSSWSIHLVGVLEISSAVPRTSVYWGILLRLVRKVTVKLNYAQSHEHVRGSGGITPHNLNLNISCRWVVSFTTRPLYLGERFFRYPLEGRLGVSQSRYGHCGREKNHCFCQEWNPDCESSTP